MSSGAWMMVLASALALGALGFVIWSLVRSIVTQRSKGRSLWRSSGSGWRSRSSSSRPWIGHAIAQWQVFTDQQLEHGQTATAGDFFAEFAQATLENWQSEFLQLFAFVVLAAMYIHKGSSESKDGEEKIEASLRRIEEHLGTLPGTAPAAPAERWKLPHTPLEAEEPDVTRMPGTDAARRSPPAE